LAPTNPAPPAAEDDLSGRGHDVSLGTDEPVEERAPCRAVGLPPPAEERWERGRRCAVWR
jgi:hypothetical protein